jgi:hypothetical protein
MLEQKLIVNRYINLALQNIAAPHYADGDFVRVQVQDCYLAESTGVFTKTSAVRAGTGPKAHRNFKWLPWLPGAISEVALVGADVLTGPMSGCWLVSYRKPNGVPHAGHLGTDIASVVRTNAVNNAWNNFATATPLDVIGGFNPLRHWNGNLPARQNGEPALPPKIFGLFTTAGPYYIVMAYQQATVPTMMRIAGIQLVPSVTLARLQQVHTPGP